MKIQTYACQYLRAMGKVKAVESITSLWNLTKWEEAINIDIVAFKLFQPIQKLQFGAKTNVRKETIYQIIFFSFIKKKTI